MNRRKFLDTSARTAALGLTALSCAHSAARDLRRSAHEPDAERLLSLLRTPGAAAQGIVNGRTFLHVAGVRATGKPEPILPATIFSAASLTKPVFAFAVRRLVRNGQLEYTRPLQGYLPLGLTGDASKITAEHVLSHTTGLVNWRFDPSEELKAAFAPGSRWRYSGEGYVLLQRVVERIVGAPLGRHLDSVVLPALGMNASTFTWTPEIETNGAAEHDEQARPLERSATNYARQAYQVARSTGRAPADVTYDEYMASARASKAFAMPIAVAPNAAGSLWTTIGDYFTFLERSIADAAAHPDEYRTRIRVNDEIGWTLGWGTDSSMTSPAWFHWGDGPGIKNFTWWQPASRTALVIFTNGDHGASFYRVLLRRLLGADPLAPDWI